MNNKEKNFLSAVVYIRNNEDKVEQLIKNLTEVLENNFDLYEVICVNDASEDDSVGRIKELAKRLSKKRISILNFYTYQGIEKAMYGGVSSAIGDYVLEIDYADALITNDSLMALYGQAISGCDIVGASPEHRQSLKACLFYKVFNKHSGMNQELDTEYYRILSRRAINRIGAMSNYIPYRKVAYARSGLKYDKLRVSDKHGKNKDGKYAVNLAIDAFIMYTKLGFRISSALTLLMMLLFLVISVYAVVIRIMGIPVEGWTSTVMLISFGFFAVFGVMSIIVRYLQILMELLLKPDNIPYSEIEKAIK